LGATAEIIDYHPAGHDLKERRTGWRRFVPSIGGLRSDHFVRTKLPLSAASFTTHAEVDRYVREQRFDAVLTGSDQVWYRNPFLGFDRAYFLDVGDPAVTARISYAPSSGPSTDLGPDQEEGRRILQTYKAVAVRDANTLALAHSLGRNDAVEVLDPTLMADLRPLVGKRPLADNYLLITGGMNAQAYALLKEVAARERLKVIEIGRRCPYADKSRPFVNPQEWVNHIAHASLVASSLFHGCAVSISLQRPFLALDTAGRGFKLGDMLKRLEMEDRLLSADRLSPEHLPADLCTFDYTKRGAALARWRATSLDYLRSALHA
jgi:hypothetical protein